MTELHNQNMNLNGNIDSPRDKGDFIQHPEESLDEVKDETSRSFLLASVSLKASQKQINAFTDAAALPSGQEPALSEVELNQGQFSVTNNDAVERFGSISPDLKVPDQDALVPDENLQGQFRVLNLNERSPTSNHTVQESDSIVPLANST
jgi:hypothetical protein